uniref:Alpha-L-arabinofuranosidase 1 catalytic domain-containing protein n=2 Tax=Bionectria ochroleuca TaxID=29856 RepID=A0A0B7K8K6_BIOOC
MTTFTKITDEQQPVISVNPAFKLSDIDDKTYSGFTEFVQMRRVPLRTTSKDVIEALKELNSPVVRYPDGNFCATYHWQDGIGPRENRHKRPELAWIGLESNQFGTDEYMKWCEKVGISPYIALNMNTGTLDEALAWVEYRNSTQDTYYANLRRKNGHEKPYNVKYWALGNEMWGPWQVEQMTKEDYAKKVFQWAKALKLLDPSIGLILCGKEGQDAWDYHVLKECIKFDRHARGNDGCLMEMHSIHLYTCSNDHLENVTAPRAAERCIEMTGAVVDLVLAENKIPSHVRKQKVCFDEWNVWDSSRANGRDGAEEKRPRGRNLAQCLHSPEQVHWHGQHCTICQCHLAPYDNQVWHLQADNVVAVAAVLSNGLSDIRCMKYEAASFEDKEFGRKEVNMTDTILLMLHSQKSSAVFPSRGDYFTEIY